MPCSFIESDATTTATAHPSDAVPTLSTFCACVEALHFAIALATFGSDTGHTIGFIVVIKKASIDYKSKNTPIMLFLEGK